jgi:hypothetical protein
MSDTPSNEPGAGPIELTEEQLAAAQAAADLGILGDASAPHGYVVDPNHVPNPLDQGGIITTEYHGVSAYDLPRSYGVFDPTYVPESTAGGPVVPPPAAATDYAPDPSQPPPTDQSDEPEPDEPPDEPEEDQPPPEDQPADESTLPAAEDLVPAPEQTELPPAVAQAVAEQDSDDDATKEAFLAQAKLHPGASPEQLKQFVAEAAATPPAQATKAAKAPAPAQTRDTALEATPAAAGAPGEDKVITEAEGGAGTSS